MKIIFMKIEVIYMGKFLKGFDVIIFCIGVFKIFYGMVVVR